MNPNCKNAEDLGPVEAKPDWHKKLNKSVKRLVEVRPPAGYEPFDNERGHNVGKTTSTRTAKYRGHTIKIVTTYEFFIDENEVLGHFSVNEAGRMHCHDLPNYTFSSAIDMAKKLIELMSTGKPTPDQLNEKKGD